jgi:hypothetical protein
MSADATGWVYKHSPYRGAPFSVHLAMADSCNDQNDNEFWMRQGKLATKARCSRKAVNEALATMLGDGLLKLIEEGTGGANRYQLLMPEGAPLMFDRSTATGVPVTSGDTTPSPQATEDATGGDIDLSPEVTQNPSENPNPSQDEEQGALSGAADPALYDESRRLCDLLADLIEANGSKRPTVTAAWVSEGERMLRLDGREPDKVERCIRWCQADPFWRANILSMTKLRAKYDQLRLAAQRQREGRLGAAAPVTASREAPEGRVQL